jgi:lactoylglutathione lyase
MPLAGWPVQGQVRPREFALAHLELRRRGSAPKWEPIPSPPEGSETMTTTKGSSIAGVRFGHVAFRVRDLGESIKWYADAFGATEAFRANRDDGAPQLVYVELAPGQFVELFPNGKNPIEQPADPLGYQHVCLLVDDLDAALAHLAGMGVTPTTAAREGRAGQRLAFVNDLDGNRIELMQIPPGSPIYRG